MTFIPLSPPHGASEPISLDEAYAAIERLLAPIATTETVSLAEASDRVLATEARSGIPLPAFDNSAVDGYGIHEDDVAHTGKLDVIGRVTAGNPSTLALRPGQAVHLATGAIIPEGVATVAMHEKTVRAGANVVLREPHAIGANIRKSGEDVTEGSVVVHAGTLLDYRHVAILASAGLPAVSVRRKVRVALLSTGDEVRPAGERLETGQIYDVNSPMLSALLDRGYAEVVASPHTADDAETIGRLLLAVSDGVDLIITTGGAAGSDSDHALAAVLAAGGLATSLRLSLRPGKPIVVGRIGPCLVLSLPGNPLAALVNFLLFARPAMLALSGKDFRRPRGQAAVAAEQISHTAGRTEFAPGRIVGIAPDGRPLVVRIGRGGSARLRPLVDADGLIELDPDRSTVETGAPLHFHPFSASFAP
ncbi:MAG: molybdopterin molybdotransferase MoeA [Devosia sp.]|uniref:molybdopterin molybdotransferase MoeA n=1 Tax=Devosia sp. TaxID=1871048 RepID=UPI001AD2F1F5|nr:gephyrin-like molybdotransferase Glp [Devosia sp.]MBN9317863.1 molybdopterin molybdotransferase MoeA [Devosia sp.]